jgi:hypothetical protein
MTDLPGEDVGGVSELFNQDLNVRNHDVYERHEYGRAFPIPAAPALIGANVSARPGSSLAPARADHVHGINSSIVRVNSYFTSPALSAGDIPTLPSNVPTLVPASQILVAASTTHSRYAVITAVATYTLPTQGGTETNWVCGVSVYQSQNGGGFTLINSRGLVEQTMSLSSYRPARATPTWTEIAAVNFNTSYAYQIVLYSEATSATINSGSVKMSILLVPTQPVTT